MIKMTKSLTLVFAVLLALAACSNPAGGDFGGGGNATITIDLGSGSVPGRAAQGISIDELTHVLKFTGPSGTQTRTITGGGTVSVTVVAGTWKIDVEAYYKGELYAMGFSTVEVRAGQNTNVSIQMNVVWAEPADGSGGGGGGGGGGGTPAAIGNPAYPITIEADANGTASASLTSATSGTTVTINASPNTYYQFKQWVVLGGGVTLASGTATNGNSFVMPAGAVRIRAEFESAPAAALSLSGISFSAISYGDSTPATQTVTVTNTGSEDADVTGITLPPGSPFTLASLPSMPVTIAAGGGSATFDIQPNVADAGTYTDTVTVTYSGGGANTTATTDVSFTINKANSTVNWPGVLIGSSYTITATYSPTDTLAAYLPSPSISPYTPGSFAWALGSTTPVGDAGSRSFTLNFTPTDTANYNSASTSIYFTVDKATGAGVSGAPTVNGSPGPISITVNTVTIPTNPGGQTVEYAIYTLGTITDTTTPALSDLTWAAATGGTTTDFSGLTPSTPYYVYARSKALDPNYNAGPHQVSTAITTVAATITLAITDPVPPADVTFAAANFGYASPPAAQTIEITNTGNADGSVTAIALSGGGTSAFALTKSGASITYPLTVAQSGGTNTFDVRPKASLDAGTYTETITVTHNGGTALTVDAVFTVDKIAGAAVSGAPTLDSETYYGLTINAVSVNTSPTNTGQVAEYAINTTSTPPALASDWQTTLTFGSTTTPLTSATYYIFARSKENTNYNAGTAQVLGPVSKKGGTTLTITFTQITELSMGIADITLSRSGSGGNPKSQVFSLSNPTQYDVGSIKWYFHNTEIGTGSPFTFTVDTGDSTNYKSDCDILGTQFLTVEVEKDGVPYSNYINLTIDN